MRRPAFKYFILSFFLILASCLLITVRHVYAQTNASYTAPVNNADVPQNLHTYSQSAMIETMSAMICQLSGVDIIQKNHQCLGIDPFNQRIGYAEDAQGGVTGGTIGTMSNLISATFQIPISSGQYFSYLASNFGLSKPALAAAPGTGFEGLKPIMPIWTTIRDLVYIIFVLGFVIIGIGIMLRIKIDPRTVMTLQNRIPKIIMGLVLVTFSYAIAGFLIDIMWVSIYIVINLFTSAGGSAGAIPQAISNYTQLSEGNVLTYANEAIGIWNVSSDATRGFTEVVGAMINNGPGNTLVHLFGTILGGAIGGGAAKLFNSLGTALKSLPVIGTVGSIISGVAGAVTGFAAAEYIAKGVVSIVVFLIILVAVLSALFRLWFKLLIAFINILLGLILSPLWIFAGLIPGNKLGFGSWMRHMLSNIVVFPMTVGMFIIGNIIISAYNTSGVVQGFVPPLLGYGGTQASISSLIALGIILITPNVTRYASEVFKGPKLDVTPIGQSIKAGTSTYTSAAKPIGAYFAKTPHLGQKGGPWGVARQLLKF